MTSVSVIIPAYNEERAIASVLQRLPRTSLDLEMIVVDDGSTDRTGERAQAAGARVVHQPSNGGYGLALKAGIRAASHELIAISDADGTYPVEELPRLVARMGEGFDMVIGMRQGREYWGTFLKMPARFLFQFLVQFSTGRRIPDVNSGFRVFRKRDVVPLFPLLCDTFSFTTTLTLAYCFLHRFIGYVPIVYGKRVGHSKVHFVRDSLRTLQYLVESIAYFNPLKLFLLLSSPFFLVGGLALLVALVGGEMTWFLPGTVLVVGGVVVFGMGLAIHALRHGERWRNS